MYTYVYTYIHTYRYVKNETAADRGCTITKTKGNSTTVISKCSSACCLPPPPLSPPLGNTTTSKSTKIVEIKADAIGSQVSFSPTVGLFWFRTNQVASCSSIQIKASDAISSELKDPFQS